MAQIVYMQFTEKGPLHAHAVCSLVPNNQLLNAAFNFSGAAGEVVGTSPVWTEQIGYYDGCFLFVGNGGRHNQKERLYALVNFSLWVPARACSFQLILLSFLRWTQKY